MRGLHRTGEQTVRAARPHATSHAMRTTSPGQQTTPLTSTSSNRWLLFVCALQVARSVDLVYGGGSIGLMGLVSQAVYDGGRHVIG